MKEKNQTIIFIAVAVVVLVVVFILSNVFNRSYVTEITYEEYINLINSDQETYVYVGTNSTSIKTELNDYGKDKKTNIYYLNPEILTEEEQEEFENDSFITIKDNEIVSKHDIKLTEVTVDEYLKLIKEDGYHFMFIGSATCGYCTLFKESISAFQLFNDFDFYYLDLNNVTEQSDYDKLLSSDEYLEAGEWGTPTSILYKDGKKVDLLSGYVSTQNLEEFLKENGAI